MDKKKKEKPAPQLVIPSRKVTDISSPSKCRTPVSPTPPIPTQPSDDEDDMIQKRFEALESTIRARDERIEKLQATAEK
jgi:hypothetical protein